MAQTVWTGTVSTTWNNPANWSDGLPQTDEEVAIPTTPDGPNSPIIDVPTAIDYQLSVASDLQIEAPVLISGSLTVFADATLTQRSSITNNGQIDNDGLWQLMDGSLINNNEINHAGQLECYPGTQIQNADVAWFQAFGTISMDRASLYNYGDFTFDGIVLDNSGLIENHGQFVNNSLLRLTTCSIFRNLGSLDNVNTIENNGIYYAQGNFTGNSILESSQLLQATGQVNAISSCIDLEGWTHFFGTDQTLLCSVQAGAQDIGQLDNGTLRIEGIHLPNTSAPEARILTGTNYQVADEWYLWNRFWRIQSNATGTTFPVRFYFTSANFEFLRTQMPLLQRTEELVFAQLQGVEEDDIEQLPAGQFQPFYYQTNLNPDGWILGQTSLGGYSELQLEWSNIFSLTAGAEIFNQGTIPYQEDFAVEPQNDQSVQLRWSQEREIAAVAYQIEAGINPDNLSVIAELAATGDSLNRVSYTFVDQQPDVQRTNYYRLRQLRQDGQTRLSPLRSATFTTGQVQLYPNPSENELWLLLNDFPNGKVTIEIVDVQGIIRYRDVLHIINNQGNQNLFDLIDLEPGLFHLRVTSLLDTQRQSFIRR